MKARRLKSVVLVGVILALLSGAFFGAPSSASALPAFTSTGAYKKLNSYVNTLSKKKSVKATQKTKSSYRTKLNQLASTAKNVADKRFATNKTQSWNKNRVSFNQEVAAQKPLLYDNVVVSINDTYDGKIASLRAEYRAERKEIFGTYSPKIQAARAKVKKARKAARKKKGKALRKQRKKIVRLQAASKVRVGKLIKKRTVEVDRLRAELRRMESVTNNERRTELDSALFKWREARQQIDKAFREEYQEKVAAHRNAMTGEKARVNTLKARGAGFINSMPAK